MTFFDSKVSKFRIDDTSSVQRDLSAYLTEVRGLPGPRALNEVTALGDGGARFIPGLEDIAIGLRGLFDDTAASGPDAVLGPLRTHTAAVDFEYGPGGWWEIETRPRWSHLRQWVLAPEDGLVEKALAALTADWSFDEEPTEAAVSSRDEEDLGAVLEVFRREVAPLVDRRGQRPQAEALFASLASGVVPVDFTEAHMLAATGWSWQTLQDTPADVVRDLELYLEVSRAVETGGSLDFDTRV